VTSEEVIVAVIDALKAVDVPFMVVGSMATNFYGVPRSTRDADFVIQVPPPFAAFAERLGPNLHLAAQASFEGVTSTLRHRIEARGTPFTVELFELSDDPHDVSRFARRRHVVLFGKDVFVATAEDTVVTKLRWAMQPGREKDVDDVRNVIAVQGDSLDWAYVQHWCDQHGTSALLESIRRSIDE
jgi:hypothetical protein